MLVREKLNIRVRDSRMLDSIAGIAAMNPPYINIAISASFFIDLSAVYLLMQYKGSCLYARYYQN